MVESQFSIAAKKSWLLIFFFCWAILEKTLDKVVGKLAAGRPPGYNQSTLTGMKDDSDIMLH